MLVNNFHSREESETVKVTYLQGWSSRGFLPGSTSNPRGAARGRWEPPSWKEYSGTELPVWRWAMQTYFRRRFFWEEEDRSHRQLAQQRPHHTTQTTGCAGRLSTLKTCGNCAVRLRPLQGLARASSAVSVRPCLALPYITLPGLVWPTKHTILSYTTHPNIGDMKNEKWRIFHDNLLSSTKARN